MKPTPVALVGCGKIARLGHLPALRAAAESGQCTLVGACDPVPEQAEALAAASGVPVFSSMEEMLDKARPQAVHITTAPTNHCELTLRALDAGCHVLCEKPIAMNAGDAERMVQAAARADRLLSICFQYRHWDESIYLRKRIADGDIGHVHAVRTWGGGMYDFPVHRLNAGAGGVLAHWTIHNLDLVLWLLGNPEPLTASAFCHQRLHHYPQAVGPTKTAIDPDELDPTMEDFGFAMVRLASDTVVTVEADWLQPPSPRRDGWEFVGALGAASIWPSRVWLDRGDEWVDDTPPAGTLAPCSYDMDRLVTAFLRAVRGGGAAPVSAPEIMRVQVLIDALYASAASGREMPVVS